MSWVIGRRALALRVCVHACMHTRSARTRTDTKPCVCAPCLSHLICISQIFTLISHMHSCCVGMEKLALIQFLWLIRHLSMSRHKRENTPIETCPEQHCSPTTLGIQKRLPPSSGTLPFAHAHARHTLRRGLLRPEAI